MQYKFSDRLDISTNYSFTRGIRNATYSDGYLNSSVRGQALTKMPNMSPYIIGDDGKPTKEYFTPYTYFQGSFASNSGIYNPVALVNEALNRNTSVSSLMIFNLHYKIAKSLDYYGIIGFQTNMNKTEKYLPQSVTGESFISKYTGISSDGGSDVLYLTTENRLIFNRSFDENNKLLLSGVWQTTDQNTSSYSSSTTGNASVGLIDPIIGSNTRNYSGGSGNVIYRSMGGLFNSQYSYKDRYILNAGYRIEASSSLSPKKRWGGFPTVGVAWIFGDEKIFEKYKFLSLGKIRLNWGQSANSPSGSAPYVGSLSAIIPGYGYMPAIQPVSIQLDNIGYEIITQSNIGLISGFSITN
jgi:hypothetical protein